MRSYHLAQLSGATLAASIALIAGLFDVWHWNSACGVRVKIYPYIDSLFIAAIIFLACLPGLVAKSKTSKNISSVMIVLIIVSVFIFAESCLEVTYQSNCYTGGHENGPGESAVLLVFAVPFAALNLLLPILDWLVWAAKRLRNYKL